MEHLFVINPRSVKSDFELKCLQDEIASCVKPHDTYDIHVSRYPRDAVGIVNKYAAQYKDGIRIYAVGGDGLLFDCLNGMMGYPEAELAAVPYGRTNDFARAVSGSDTRRLRDINELLTAPSVQTDVVMCGGNYYINFCSVGVESYSIEKWYKIQARLFDTRVRSVIRLITMLSGVAAIFEKDIANQYYEVMIDGVAFDGNYASISFSNGPYCGGSWSISPDAIFNDGQIDVLLVKGAHPLKLLYRMLGYLKGHYTKYPDYVKHIRAKEIFIHSESPMFTNLDGEYFIDTTLSLRMMPSAVKIIAGGGPFYAKKEVQE